MRHLDANAGLVVGVVIALLAALALPAPAAPPEAAPSDATAARPAEKKTRTLGIVLYPRFELLDVFGPAEIFGNVNGRLKVIMVAEKAGPVASVQGPKAIADYGFDDCPPLDLVLVPGGFGTLPQLKNETLLDWLRGQGESSEIVMSVCSGSALLAKAGLLDGRRATSNKQYFNIATAQGPKVEWVVRAAGSTTAIGSRRPAYRPAWTWPCTSSSGCGACRRPRPSPTARSTNGIAILTTIRSPASSKSARPV